MEPHSQFESALRDTQSQSKKATEFRQYVARTDKPKYFNVLRMKNSGQRDEEVYSLFTVYGNICKSDLELLLLFFMCLCIMQARYDARMLRRYENDLQHISLSNARQQALLGRRACFDLLLMPMQKVPFLLPGRS